MTPMTKFSLLLFSILLALTSPLHAADPSAEIIEYGRYTSDITSLEPATGTSGGVVVSSRTNLRHVETVTRIPAQAGISFGVRYQFANLPADRAFNLRDVTKHPPIKQPDGTVMTESVTNNPHKKGSVEAGKTYKLFSSWHFAKGFEYEFVPGIYTQEIYLDDKKLAEKKFEIYKP